MAASVYKTSIRNTRRFRRSPRLERKGLGFLILPTKPSARVRSIQIRQSKFISLSSAVTKKETAGSIEAGDELERRTANLRRASRRLVRCTRSPSLSTNRNHPFSQTQHLRYLARQHVVPTYTAPSNFHKARLFSPRFATNGPANRPTPSPPNQPHPRRHILCHLPEYLFKNHPPRSRTYYTHQSERCGKRPCAGVEEGRRLAAKDGGGEVRRWRRGRKGTDGRRGGGGEEGGEEECGEG